MKQAFPLLRLSVMCCLAGHAMAAGPASMSGAARSANEVKSSIIFSNLAVRYPKGLYFTSIFSPIYGANGAGTGQPEAVAAGFTPAADATATRLALALTWPGENGQLVTVSLLSDNAGIPGTALWSKDVNVTTVSGQCCGLLTLPLKGGVALKGGTHYWVAVSAEKNSEINSLVQWAPEWIEPSVPIPQISAGNDGTGWVSAQNNGQSAFAVYGN